MNAVDTQILTLSKEGLSAEEIAEALSLDEGAVKFSLLENSPEFRRSNNKAVEIKKDVTDDELDEFFTAYKDLVRNTDNPFIKEKGLRFLINEAKGRNDTQKNFLPLNGGINILLFNESIKRIKEVREKTKMPSIEISSS